MNIVTDLRCLPPLLTLRGRVEPRGIVLRAYLFASAASLMIAPAFAQTSADAPREIVVTASLEAYEPEADIATRTGTPLLELPFVSDAVGATLIADRGLTNLTDALRTVPGAAPVAGIGNFNTRFRLRGFVSTNILRNGFRQALGFNTTDVAHIDRIEVLKGPASALYGRFEPGGVINIVTRQPLSRNRYAARITDDDDGQLRGTVDLNWAASNAVQARVNAAYDNGESFRDFVDNPTFFVAPSVAAALGPDTRLIVEGEYSDRDGVFDRGFVSNVQLLALPPARFLGDPADTFRNRTSAASVTLEHGDVDDVRLRLGGSYSRSRSDGFYFFPVAGGAGVPLISATGILNRRIQTTFDIQRDWTVMAEIAGRFSTGPIEHTVLGAAEYNRDAAVSQIIRSTTNAGINIFNPVYGAARPAPTATIVNTTASNKSFAGIAQLESAWTPWLRTTVGVRLERIKSRFVDNALVRSGAARETALTPRAGLTILPGNSFAIYANYGRSFAPEVTTRPIVGGGQPEPSIGEQIEAGIRWERADGRIRASAALFEITKTNIRVAEPAGSPFDRQVGEQRSRGFEIDAAAQPVENLRFELAYAYTDATVTRDATLIGRRLQATPEHAASLWTRWDVHPQIGMGAGIFLVSDRFVDTQNSFALDGHARADFALFWRPINRVELQLNLLNAFDVGYFENGNTNNNFYPGQPRTIRATVSVTL
jgi:iron complex outermembrane recepter protein